MEELQILKDNYEEFLNYMKSRYPLYHLSNVFVQDMMYAIMGYFQDRGRKLSFARAEYLAREFASFLEGRGVFKRIEDRYSPTWVLNYPKFKKEPVKRAG